MSLNLKVPTALSVRLLHSKKFKTLGFLSLDTVGENVYKAAISPDASDTSGWVLIPSNESKKNTYYIKSAHGGYLTVKKSITRKVQIVDKVDDNSVLQDPGTPQQSVQSGTTAAAEPESKSTATPDGEELESKSAAEPESKTTATPDDEELESESAAEPDSKSTATPDDEELEAKSAAEEAPLAPPHAPAMAESDDEPEPGPEDLAAEVAEIPEPVEPSAEEPAAEEPVVEEPVVEESAAEEPAVEEPAAEEPAAEEPAAEEPAAAPMAAAPKAQYEKIVTKTTSELQHVFLEKDENGRVEMDASMLWTVLSNKGKNFLYHKGSRRFLTASGDAIDAKPFLTTKPTLCAVVHFQKPQLVSNIQLKAQGGFKGMRYWWKRQLMFNGTDLTIWNGVSREHTHPNAGFPVLPVKYVSRLQTHSNDDDRVDIVFAFPKKNVTIEVQFDTGCILDMWLLALKKHGAQITDVFRKTMPVTPSGSSFDVHAFDPFLFIKHGTAGNPHCRVMYYNGVLKRLQWRDPTELSFKSKDYIDMADLSQIRTGKRTAKFVRHVALQVKPELCFSLIYNKGKSTLDIQADTVAAVQRWVESISNAYLLATGKEVLGSQATINAVDLKAAAVAEGDASYTFSLKEGTFKLDDAVSHPQEEFYFEPLVVKKHGRRGNPHFRVLTVDQKRGKMYWSGTGLARGFDTPVFDHSKPSSAKAIKLSSITAVKTGKSSDVFKRDSAAEVPSRNCFSLYCDGRTLDFEASTGEERDQWLERLSNAIDIHVSDDVRGLSVSRFSSEKLYAKYNNLTTDMNTILTLLFNKGTSYLVNKDFPRLAKNVQVYQCQCNGGSTEDLTHTTCAEGKFASRVDDIKREDSGNMLKAMTALTSVVYGADSERAAAIVSGLTAAVEATDSAGTDIQASLATFFDAEFANWEEDADDRTLLTILKTATQSLLVPYVEIVKKKIFLDKALPTQDVKGGWIIQVIAHKNKFDVIHLRAEQSRTQLFQINSRVVSEFNKPVNQITKASITLDDVQFSSATSQVFREQIASRLSLLHRPSFGLEDIKLETPAVVAAEEKEDAKAEAVVAESEDVEDDDDADPTALTFHNMETPEDSAEQVGIDGGIMEEDEEEVEE